jgi:hypothetical protein
MSDIFGNVKTFVRGRIESRAHAVGFRCLRLADAMRTTVRDEQSRETAMADNAGESIADRLERAGRYLSDANIERSVSDLESAARRGPLTFTAASFVLAFATTRFFKASRSA